MINSKLCFLTISTSQLTLKRGFLAKIFSKCGCGKKKKEPEEPPCQPIINTCVETKGMRMPRVGLGTWQLTCPDLKPALECALSCGYRHIDTSPMFENEKDIGEALCDIFGQGYITRDKLFITSKLPHFAMSPEQVPLQLHNTLKNLKLNYLDLYMIHFPVGVKIIDDVPCADPHNNYVAVWKEMEKLVSSGKVKSLGLSNFNVRQVRNILASATVPPANIQVEMHLYCQQHRMLCFCTEHCIGLTAYAPLGSPNLQNFLKESGICQHGIPQPLENYSIKKIAQCYKKSQSQILLRYLLQKSNLVAVIPKSKCPERIKNNIGLYDFCLKPCEMNELCSLDMKDDGRMFNDKVWQNTKKHCDYPF